MSAAARWHRRLLAAVGTLKREPQRCPIAPEAEEIGIELRELLFGKRRGVYRIFFIIAQRTVDILHIRHSAQMFCGETTCFESQAVDCTPQETNGAQPMNDPIVDEVRRIRNAHAARFNYDLDAIFQDIKEQERKSNREFVSLRRENIAPEKATQPAGLTE